MEVDTIIQLKLSDFIDLFDEFSEKTAKRVINKMNENPCNRYISVNRAAKLICRSHKKTKELAESGYLKLCRGKIDRESITRYLENK